MKAIGLIDTMYLCHRARYSTGCADMEHDGMKTGVAFGVLQELAVIKDLLDLDQYIFAFDGEGSIRRKLVPTYKEARRNREKSEDELAEEKSFFEQVDYLRNTILPGMGYQNIFSADGYEGDDVIARIAREEAPESLVFIVSSDQDFFQCLTDNVRIYVPASEKKPWKVWTEENFAHEFKIWPSQWALVKSIAGCVSDSVVGIKGVGEKTAIKWLNSEVKEGSAAHQKMVTGLEAGVIEKNAPIVTLPLLNTPSFELVEDCVTDEAVKSMWFQLGFSSERKSTITRESGMRRFF